MRASHRLGALVGMLVCLAAMSTAAPAEEQAAITPTAPPPSETTPPPAPPATQDTSSQQKDDEIVCKKEPAPIGSRIGARKVCKTVAEWRRIQAAAKETTDEIQNRKIPPPAS